MAEPVKRGDRYRHTFMFKGERYSGTFDTKREARDWEADTRRAASTGEAPAKTKKHLLTDGIDKYLSSVSTMKKDGAEIRERRRFNALLSYLPKGIHMEDITSEMVSGWRTDRLQEVTGSTVNRDWNLYGNLFNVARREWKWLSVNPFSDVKRPDDNAPRDSVWRWQNIRAMIREGQKRGGKYLEVTQAFRISLHTAARLKEALVVPSTFNPSTGVFTLTDRKESKKLVSISVPTIRRARRVIMSMPKSFAVKPNEASTLFCKLRDQVGIDKRLQLLDARATALTLMSKRVDVKTLQRISRHKDINILMNTYYRETAEEISSRL